MRRVGVAFGEMSGSAQKRSSKWDLKEEIRSPFDDVQHDAWHGKAGVSFHEKEPCGRLSPQPADDRHKWSAMEPLPGRRRASHRDGNIDEDRSRTLKAMTTWDGEEKYGIRMSPGLDEWRQGRHLSPRNGWKRSRRSHSRSHSLTRSRSRSRSPAHGFRRDSGMYDRSRNRSGVSTQICKDFASGRCKRGNHCQFLHQGTASYEDSWERRRKPIGSNYSIPHDSKDFSLVSGRSTDCCNDFLKGSCRRGASCRFAHHGASDASVKGSTNEMIRERDNDRRHRDASPERRERDSRRAPDVPCKFFAAGHCRNGKYCRFSHDSRVSPDRRSRDGRSSLGQSSDAEKLLNFPKWNDSNTYSDAMKWDENKNEKMDAPEPRVTGWSTGDGWSLDQNSDVEKLQNIPKWRDTNTSDVTNLSENRNEPIGAPAPRVTGWSMDDRWGHSLDKNETRGDPSFDHKAVEGGKTEPLQWTPENATDNRRGSKQITTDNWLGDMEMSPEWNYRVQPSNCIDKGEPTHLSSCEPGITREASGMMHDGTTVVPPIRNETSIQRDYNLREVDANALPLDDRSVTGKTGSSYVNFSANILPTQSFNQNGLNTNSLPLPNLNAAGRSQVTMPTDPSRGESIINLRNQTPFLEGKAINQPDTGNANASLVNSGIPTTQNMVISELSQLTNISASLAQLIANGQQLPQLYVAHNSQSGKDLPSFANSEMLVKPESVVTIQPNRDIEFEPISDCIEPTKHVTDGKIEIPSKNLSTSSFAGADVEVTRENNGIGTDERRKVQEESKTENVNSPLENIDGDGKADDSKKSKDAKGIRAFKFALVEFVKDLLKPTWKEGQMTKDAYKNIVKKVVDKVTGSMQGANIPQTQEKIEQYLSVSKPKLTKLVQAYVEKRQKDK